MGKKIDKTSRKKFIKSVAKDVIKGLSEKDKEYMKENPDSYHYHFSLGLYIRNKYIHGKKLPIAFWGDPDDLSGDILDEIIKRLTTDPNSSGKENSDGTI